MTTDKNNTASDPQPAELAEQQGVALPRLPEAFEAEFAIPGASPVSVYTAEQMQDYARAAVAATGKQQGIDLGQQQDAARWRAIAPLLSVEWDEDEQLKRWTWIDFKGGAPAIPSPTRQEYASVDEAVDALISQHDAAPGVGNG